MHARGIAASLVALALAAPAQAQDAPPLEIPRLTGPIELDGRVDEPAWDVVEPLPMTMFSPSFGEPITEPTEIRVAHDDEYLYLSGRLYDSDPDAIRTNTFYRNETGGDDLIAVVIDSFDDLETAVWFITNPAGARSDRSVSNDAVFSGGMPMNSDWNAHWDVETSVSDEGWFAEFRIPFSTLGFQARDGDVTMGLITYRFISRKNERQIFPPIDPSWGGLAFAKPSQARRVRMSGVRQQTPVYVTPYTLGGVDQFPEQEPDGPWSTRSDATVEAGVDLKVSPVPNLSLDLTVNTDFAQVEADAQQVNLTRFALFFPEKRQFFQERSSTFEFNVGGGVNRLFHSRRIGLDGGEPVRIYGGGRAVGRVGGTDFGVLTMQAESALGPSSENLSVVRINQEVFNRFSSVGGMVTSRLGEDGRNNVAYGLDTEVRLWGDEWVTAKWAQSFDEGIDEGSALDAGVIQARWDRRRDDGLSYAAELIRVGGDYNPGLGFQNRRDFLMTAARVQYRQFRDAESPLRSVMTSGTVRRYVRNPDGSTETSTVEAEGFVDFKGGTSIRIGLDRTTEDIRRPFTVAGLEVPAGLYRFHSGEVRIQLPRNDPFRTNVTASAGEFYDGERFGLQVAPSWNQSRYLELGGAVELNRLRFPERDASVTAGVARLNARLALNTSVSLSTFAQYSNLGELTLVNARFRYHFREGTDLWIVYNEGVHTSGDPSLPRSAGRTIMIKYSHALIL